MTPAEIKAKIAMLTPQQRRDLMVWLVNEQKVSLVAFDMDRATLKSVSDACANGDAVQINACWSDSGK